MTQTLKGSRAVATWGTAYIDASVPCSTGNRGAYYSGGMCVGQRDVWCSNV